MGNITERVMPDFQNQLASLREALARTGAAEQDARGYGTRAATMGSQDLESLRTRIDDVRRELQEELKREIESLRLLSEHSAVRAGFLAVAASECAAEEKAWLFSKLKAREEALSANPAWKNVEALQADAFPQMDDNREWQVLLEKP